MVETYCQTFEVGRKSIYQDMCDNDNFIYWTPAEFLTVIRFLTTKEEEMVKEARLRFSWLSHSLKEKTPIHDDLIGDIRSYLDFNVNHPRGYITYDLSAIYYMSTIPTGYMSFRALLLPEELESLKGMLRAFQEGWPHL